MQSAYLEYIHIFITSYLYIFRSLQWRLVAEVLFAMRNVVPIYGVVSFATI